MPVAMINQTFARQFFKDGDPVGEELNLGTAEKPDWWRIVGVTGDVKASARISQLTQISTGPSISFLFLSSPLRCVPRPILRRS